MRYDDVIKYLDENKLEELLKQYSPMFEALEEIRKGLYGSYYDNHQLVIEAINQSTGLYSGVLLPYEIIQEHIDTVGSCTAMANMEDSATLLKQKVIGSTGNVRKTVAIFKAYTKSAEQFIISLQSILKGLEKERQTGRHDI